MNFAFTDEQEELRETARAFLAEHAGSEQVRAAMASERGWDDGLWKQLGSELGWTAVHIPEQYGGLGMGTLELVALLEVMGERLVCSPFFSTVCLAANAILCAASEAQKGGGVGEPVTAAQVVHASSAVAQEIPSSSSSSSSPGAGPGPQAMTRRVRVPNRNASSRERRRMACS